MCVTNGIPHNLDVPTDIVKSLELSGTGAGRAEQIIHMEIVFSRIRRDVLRKVDLSAGEVCATGECVRVDRVADTVAINEARGS